MIYKTNGNHKYTSELKQQAIIEYLDGNSSLMDIYRYIRVHLE